MNTRLLLIPVLLGLAALACTGAPQQMQILDAPVYVCPTATPRPTDTPAPTAVQPAVTVPASGWATLTPRPGCIWDGVRCAPNTAVPGGIYTTPGYAVPGSTSTPRPTTTPYQTPTPFVMRPPQDFFVGDAIYTGGFLSPVSVRLRLLNVVTLPASPARDGSPRSIARWDVEIRNVGRMPYDVFPAYQMFVQTVTTPAGDVEGVWGASRDGVQESGAPSPLEAVMLLPGETRTFTLAAFIPAGTPRRFTFALDPTDRTAPPLPGRNLLVWTNTANTICAGELAEPVVLPTPIR